MAAHLPTETALMTAPPAPKTLGELRAAGYAQRTVREELRDNLLAHLRAGKRFFDGVVGYEETVVPAVENALLSGHDLIFLGERGQAKTRMIRQLVGLLDPATVRAVRDSAWERPEEDVFFNAFFK